MRKLALLVPAALLALAWAGGAAAQAPTLKTINVDGNLTDWDEVLLNPAQVTLDGDGSTLLPCAYSPDRDCPIQATGRDLREFAWTYDATHVYYYVRRQGNASNDQVFWFYMDTDGDTLMGAADRVLRIRFSGSSGATQNDLFRYIPTVAPGDPLVDPAGFADGYTLPGDLTISPTWSEASPNGGSPDGFGFEERVPWAQLGVPPGTGLLFHVASSNSPNPGNLSQQVDDNLGGPDGGLGSFSFDLVEVRPDRTGAQAPGAVATYAHDVVNAGSDPDSFELQLTSTLGLAVSLWTDPDGNGVGDVLMATDANGDGDLLDAGDVLVAGFDTNADTLPDTGPLSSGQVFRVVVVVETLPANEGQTDVTTLTAFLAEKPTLVRDRAVDTTAIGRVVVLSPDPVKNGVEGQVVSYGTRACNHTGASDTLDFLLRSSMGWQVWLYSDPECDGVRNDPLAYDQQGDGSWSTVFGGDSDGDTLPDTGLLATGECECFVVEVFLPNRVNIGTVDTTTLTATGTNPADTGSLGLVSTVSPRIEIFPDYTFAAQTELVSGADKPVYFAHVARNNWSLADRVSFAVVAPTNTQGWSVRIWSDPNGDGNIFDGAVITQTDFIPPNGGEFHFVVEVRVPPGVPTGTTSTTVVTGAAAGDVVARDTVTDELEVSSIATYSDALYSLPTSYFAPCTTIYVEGTGLERDRGGGVTDRYDLLYFDAVGRIVRFHDLFIPDAAGVAQDGYAMEAPDVPGTWTIELRDSTLTIATITVTVEANGFINPLMATSPLYPMTGAPLGVNSTLTNQNTRAPFQSTRVDYIVLDPTRTQYLVSGASSSFQPWTGTEITRTQAVPNLNPTRSFADPFTIPDVTYPMQGIYVLYARWVAGCGMLITQRESTFIVGEGEVTCSNRIDDDGDTLLDCLDPECFRDPACYELDCVDGQDGDGDTMIDCDDPDCSAAEPCIPEAACTDTVDNDRDSLIDCQDPDCFTDPSCPEVQCQSGVDEDGDTLTDCQDPDCAPDPACRESLCTDDLDNDGDMAIDCADSDCDLEPTCQPETPCDDGVDNEGDTVADCMDRDCDGDPACIETACDDDVDNEGDTVADCFDSDCAADPACVERDCADDVDNDSDLDVDCADSDCAADPACSETDTECEDTLDNDEDGDFDCFDTDCAAWPPCLGNDRDADTVPDPQDCAPDDATTWRVPDEVPATSPDHLTVTKPAGTTDALIAWTPPVPSPGTATLHDVVKGRIGQLWTDRGFTNAACLSGDQSALTVVDPELPGVMGDGLWYLVRADNGCGAGPFGSDWVDVPRVVTPPAPCD